MAFGLAYPGAVTALGQTAQNMPQGNGGRARRPRAAQLRGQMQPPAGWANLSASQFAPMGASQTPRMASPLQAPLQQPRGMGGTGGAAVPFRNASFTPDQFAGLPAQYAQQSAPFNMGGSIFDLIEQIRQRNRQRQQQLAMLGLGNLTSGIGGAFF